MIQQLFAFYKLMEAAGTQFTEAGLEPVSFMDVYRSQPFDPQLYEYFSLPTIFMDYTMQGQGTRKPRLVTMTLHILTDEMPDVSNISEQKDAGAKRFLYNIILQTILEGARLGRTTPLIFMSEGSVDERVINYHTQVYQFEAWPADMLGDVERIYGEFERLNIFGSLKQKP